MTNTWDLLVSPNPEELKGAPGPALEAALAAAASDPDHAGIHLTDAALASISAGQPRHALRLIKVLDSTDEVVRRRVQVCRAWIQQADRNLYPGFVGGEIAGEWDDFVTVGSAGSGDPLTVLLEAYASLAPVPIYSQRATLAMASGMSPAVAMTVGQSAISDLEELLRISESLEADGTRIWAMTALADTAIRLGNPELAYETLSTARMLAEATDPIAFAATHMKEGDWLSAPGSSSEALGFNLLSSSALPQPTPTELAAAEAAYTAAATALQSLEAPRAHAALALRLARVAGWRSDHVERLQWLDVARTGFDSIGDAAHTHLITVHVLLTRVDSGEELAVLAEAGTGWNQDARGPIAMIVHWAGTRGSVSWCTGLGRLCQRQAELWEMQDEPGRAETCYSMALGLLPASEAVPVDTVMGAIAVMQGKQGFASRALVRTEIALRSTPPGDVVSQEPLEWMRRADLLMSMASILSNYAGSSRLDRAVFGQDRVAEALEAHASLVDMAPGVDSLGDLHSMLSGFGVDDFIAAGNEFSQATSLTAMSLLAQARLTRAVTAIYRTRLAQNNGWEAMAENLHGEALRVIESGGSDSAWLAVLADVDVGDRQSARRRLEALRAEGALPDDLFASLALLVEAYDLAAPLVDTIQPTTWKDVVDRADLALGLGDTGTAVAEVESAITRFEEGTLDLDRDPDLIAYCDDVTAEFMYLLAVRARLDTDGGAARDPLAEAFYLSDRPRALSLRNILPGEEWAVDREMQMLATEWSAQFERLVAAIESDSDWDVAHLDELESRLLAAEAQPRRNRPASMGGRRNLLAEVQQNLPENACLLQYHAAGRELVIFAVTSHDVFAGRQTLEGRVLPGLARRFVDACASSDPGEEAMKLASLLLDPVGEQIAAHRRLLIVPYGPLNAVPFNALPFGGARLIDDHDVSYLQAASLLGSHPVDARLVGEGDVVVGDPEFDETVHDGLDRLGGARLEAEVVGDLLGTSHVLIGSDAVESDVKQHLQHRRVVHLAAHGLLNSIAPAASSIVLAGSDELTVADLIGLRIDAGLMVLSACDTGRGTATLGGDMVGLTRGLLAAGVHRSIASLWPVFDTAACVTMELFYGYLLSEGKLSPAAALAEAQRTVKRMTVGQLETRYQELGGADRDRQVRRQAGGRTRLGVWRNIPMAPEFVDNEEESEPDWDPDRPTPVAAWAPFVLFGH